ncbi:MAG: Rrf2 family transcriptional regulator [Myxococcaceae bacterium]|nr:Rrf2 family transcriptional regulator [Myxococcaceae bacterium]
MSHPLQISRKIEYGLRAMLYLAAQPQGALVPFREIAERMNVPTEFMAKILKKLCKEKLAVSTRGAQGGYAIARPAAEVSFLDVIEAMEGKVQVNLCAQHSNACSLAGDCTMTEVWQLGQQRMLEVFRHAKLDRLAMRGLKQAASNASSHASAAAELVQLGSRH